MAARIVLSKQARIESNFNNLKEIIADTHNHEYN